MIELLRVQYELGKINKTHLRLLRKSGKITADQENYIMGVTRSA